MPLVVIAGQPCSGKTSAAKLLCQMFDEAGHTAKLISENDLFDDRNSCYATVEAEKRTRAKLRSETDRHISNSTVVILDSLNNIKGYRYELWCIARTAGTKCCVLWIDTPVNTCEAWNSVRDANQAYSPAVLHDLSNRFEVPNAQTRWDTPLHVVQPANTSDLAANLQAVVYGITAAPSTTDAHTGPNAVVSGDLKPNLATMQTDAAAPNLLHDIDRAAQDILQAIMEAQAAAGPGLAAGTVQLASGLSLQLTSPINVAQLRRLKRGFLKTATSGMGYTLTGDAASRTFVAYLQEHLAQ